MFKPLNSAILLLSIILAWLLMLVFSYEFISQEINTINQQKFEKIQQQAWNLDWSLSSKAEIVSSFSADWQLTREGIKSTTDAPELSLQMSGAVIDPSIQQALQIEVEIDHTIEAESTFKLEFSNQQQNIYYVTTELPLQQLNESLDLDALTWKIINPDEAVSEGEVMQWSDIQALDALVVRFYLPKPAALTIKQVQILQVKGKDWDTNPEVDCELILQPPSVCLLSNQIRYLTNKNETSVGDQQISYAALSDLPPLTWMVLAVVVLMSTLLLTVGIHPVSMSLVVGVFAAITLLHQKWLEIYFSYLQWPLLALMIGVVWFNRAYLKLPRRAALPVWLVTVVLVIMMLVFNQQQTLSFKLMSDLPQYLLWALVQQILIGPLASQLLLRHLKIPVWLVAGMVGMLFSVIHTPNHVLMLATLVAGVAWSYAWLKYENLYANALSHAILALVFYQVMPEAWLGSARIGVFF